MWENINEMREMMKRSDSELAFEEFVRYQKTMSTNTAFSTSNPDAANNMIEVVDSNDSTPLPTRLISGFKLRRHYQDNQDDGTYSSYDTEAAASETDDVLLLSQNLTPNSSTQLDCQSSICTGGNLSSGSPLSAGNKPKRRVATSASSDHDPTDDEEEGDDDDEEVETEAGQCEQSFGEVETEAGQCEQSYDPPTVKRMRRKIANRESARRSRKRKQEHLAGLELQAEQLMGENDSLYKQLTNAHNQFCDADTNNRVLKSDVEALRAKVKLAEDRIARGSLTSGLNQLLQNHLISAQPMANHNLRRVANVSPTITIHADDSSFSGLTISGNSGPHPLSNIDISSGNLNTRMGADELSCVTDIWR